jgi:hypothetical protein
LQRLAAFARDFLQEDWIPEKIQDHDQVLGDERVLGSPWFLI